MKDEFSRLRHIKGQANIMEYILMTFFIFVIIIALMFFLSIWQVSQVQMSSASDYLERVGDISDAVMKSVYFIKGSTMVVDSMFDDSKLMAFVSGGEEVCDQLEKIFGSRWFMEVRAIEYSESENTGISEECTNHNYPDCNTWTICKTDDEAVLVVMPVNIYRKMHAMTDMGILTVGAYV